LVNEQQGLIYSDKKMLHVVHYPKGEIIFYLLVNEQQGLIYSDEKMLHVVHYPKGEIILNQIKQYIFCYEPET
jgi:hypothetical protein